MIDLSDFTGSEHYYSSTFKALSLTDGVHFLRESGNCYWLIDIIESYQKQLKNEEFQVWKLEVRDDNSAVVICEDGNNNILISQSLEYTDFKEQTGLDEITLYCCNEVVLLPSEY
jgi:hypothetical protein